MASRNRSLPSGHWVSRSPSSPRLHHKRLFGSFSVALRDDVVLCSRFLFFLFFFRVFIYWSISCVWQPAAHHPIIISSVRLDDTKGTMDIGWMMRPPASTPPPVRWERNDISLVDGKLILRLCSRRCVTSSSSSTSTATVKSGHIFHFNFSTFSAAEFLIRCRVKDKVATASAFPFNAIPNEGRRGEGRGELFMHSNSFLPPSDGNSRSSGTPLDVYLLLFFPFFFFFLFYSHFIDLEIPRRPPPSSPSSSLRSYSLGHDDASSSSSEWWRVPSSSSSFSYSDAPFAIADCGRITRVPSTI